MYIKTLALSALASLATASSAMAVAYTTYHGTFTVNNIGDVYSSSISVGDQFYFQFSVDPSVQDTVDGDGVGDFPGGFTDFKMGKIAGSGSWNPTELQTVGYAYSDRFDLIGHYENSTNWDEGIDYERYDGPSTARWYVAYLYFSIAHEDDGAGLTIPQMFGDLTTGTVRAELGVDSTYVTFTTNTFTTGEYVAAVPEASSSLLFLGSVALGVARRKRR